MKRKFFVVAAIIISSQLQAQLVPLQREEDTTVKSMDEVVLTATKSNLKQSQTGKIVTVIDQKTIATNIGRSLSELLSTQAGIFINGANNNFGTNLDFYFRGAGSGNVLLVIDGVPVYDPSAPTSNAFDINGISLDQVERIEILKGGQSTIWGSDAIAGVVQIFLKKNAKKKIAVTGSLAYGSFNTLKGNIGISGNENKLGYRIQYSYTGTKGISAAFDSTGMKNFDDDEFKQHNILAELNYRVNNSLTARIFENFSTYKAGLDAAAFTDDKDYTTRNKNNIAGVGLRYTKNKFAWNLLGSYQKASRLTIDDSSDVSSSWYNYSKGNYTGNTLNLESYINNSFSDKLELVSGVQYVQQNSDQSYLSISGFGPYESGIGKDSVKANQFSAYASLLVKNFKAFNLEVGGRFNHHSRYGNNGTFTFNPSYLIDNNSKVFINISSGYRIPTLYQLYSEYGNKDLKPERSTTYEIGLQTTSDDQKISLRIAGFKRESKNLITFGASNYINRDEQNDYGVELESKINIGSTGTWANHIAFVDGSGIQNNVKVNNLYRRPNFTLNSSLALTPVSSLTVVPSFKFIGSRLKNPFDAGPAEQPHYYTLDFFAGYEITKKIRLFVDLRNITDQQYFDIVGYNSKGFNMMAGASFNF